jgi:hypothetical protein
MYIGVFEPLFNFIFKVRKEKIKPSSLPASAGGQED